MNDDLTAVLGFLREVGASDIQLQSGGKHPRIVFRWRGQEQFFVRPSTPGDTMRGHKNAISELRHKLGLVNTEKRVGERRRRRHVAKSPEAPKCPTLTPMADWRLSLFAALPPQRKRELVDSAWLAFWRACMTHVGGVSLL